MTDRPRARPGIKPPAHPHGSLVLSRNSSTSVMERKAVQMLTAAGVDLIVERMAIQAGHDIIWDIHPLLTPDAIVVGTTVCVEIDPAWTHTSEMESDRKRNELLAAVGWTVVRLRLGGLKPVGEYDVVVDTDRIAPEGIAALIDAIADAVAGRPGAVRRVIVPKPKTVRKTSRLGAITADPYFPDGTFRLSWKPGSGERIQLMAMEFGKGLYTGESRPPEFIMQLDLDHTDRKDWRPILEAMFDQLVEADFDTVSRFPWGDDLLTGPPAAVNFLNSKFNVGLPHYDWTSNFPNVDEFDPSHLMFEGQVVGELHPGAVAAGWVLDAVELCTGWNGGYQRLALVRRPVGESAADTVGTESTP